MTTRPAAQLVVDTSAFMTLCAEDVKSACVERFFLCDFNLGFDLIRDQLQLTFRRFAAGLFNMFLHRFGDAHIEIAAELDVSAATGHIGGHSDRTGYASIGNDFSLLGVVARIQDFVRNFRGGEIS